MFWSQYLVIWYGDLPEETEFIAHRMNGAWAPLAWTVFALVFVIPFVVLLSRAVKTSPRGLTAIACVGLVGLWLERFILVSPSLWHGNGVPLGVIELLVTAGVLGLFAWCYTTFGDQPGRTQSPARPRGGPGRAGKHQDLRRPRAKGEM